MWLKVDGFSEKVRSWWNSYQLTGTPSYILAGKLKVLKNDLRKWNLEIFGNINDQRFTLSQELQHFDVKEVGGTLSEDEKVRKMVVVAELEKITLMEEISWRQKSRALWLKTGDRCTKFFHGVANSHRRNNAIEVLHSEGKALTDSIEIKNHIVHSYDKLLTEQYQWRPKVNGLDFDSMDQAKCSLVGEVL
ncbi:hypothetical protein F2P56_019612 [Juglans regia]|uniref:Uncharacterized protein n=1 Tax=Juglans regia TaxID=51240 RepID=A0A833USJ1_JUGRE|nr:hypothetical protein F2P56_019612 [Juglans regia]